MRRLWFVLCFLCALWSGLLLRDVVVAGASGPGPLSVVIVGGGPLFDLSAIYPGATLEGEVRVGNGSAEPAELFATALDVVGSDGCSPVEVKSAMPCGTGPGHLVDQLQLTIEDLSQGSSGVLWRGPVVQLDAVPLAERELDPGEVRTYRFSAHLPHSSGNETQSDGLEFDLRFDLGAGEGTGTVVEAAAVSRNPGPRLLGFLPRTGAELGRSAGIATALLLGGAATVRVARRQTVARS